MAANENNGVISNGETAGKAYREQCYEIRSIYNRLKRNVAARIAYQWRRVWRWPSAAIKANRSNHKLAYGWPLTTTSYEMQSAGV